MYAKFKRLPRLIILCLVLGLLCGAPKVTASPDSAPAVPNKCHGGTITLIDTWASASYGGDYQTIVSLVNPTITNVSAGGCNVSGQLRVQLPGNDVYVQASGTVNAYDQFQSSSIATLAFRLAGEPLVSFTPAFQSGKLLLQNAVFGVGNYAIPLLKTPTIAAGQGLQFNHEEGLRLPNLGREGLYTVVDVYGNLKIEGTGFTMKGNGDLQLGFSRWGIDETLCKLQADFEMTEYGSPSTNERAEPYLYTALKASINEQCMLGIPIEPSGTFKIKAVNGNIAATPNEQDLNLDNLTLSLNIPKVPFAVGEIGGGGRVRGMPNPGMGFNVYKGKLFGLPIEPASAQASYYLRDGLEIYGSQRVLLLLLFQGETHFDPLRSTTTSSNIEYPFNYTGTMLAAVGVAKGEIFETCSTWLCHDWCTGWFGIRYPCNWRTCRQCFSIPPWELQVSAHTQQGLFKYGNTTTMGNKGFLQYSFYSTGMFYDYERQSFKIGNVNSYELISSRMVQAARQQQANAQLAQAQEDRIPTADRFTLLHNGILLHLSNTESGTPVMSAIQPSDALSYTNVLTQADTGFMVRTDTPPLTVSLIPPTSTGIPEITPDNFDQSPIADALTISYTTSLTYTATCAQDDQRAAWRFVNAAYAPAGSDPAVNVTLDGTQVFTDVIRYADLVSGSHAVAVMPTAGGAALTTTLQTVSGTQTTLLALGLDTPTLLTVTDDNKAPAGLGNSRVRLINGIEGKTVTVEVGGQAWFTDVASLASGGYREVGAGTVDLVLKDGNGAVLATETVTLTEGVVTTLVAGAWLDQSSVRHEGLLWQISDHVYKPITLYEYIVDQAPTGDWGVKLVGDTDTSEWNVAVVAAHKPPVVEDVTVDTTYLASDGYATVAMNVKSNYAPTTISYFLSEGPITTTLAYTDTNGQAQTEVVPKFAGEELDVITITERSDLDGSQPLAYDLDLSYIPSGDYYLWVRIEDGVSPAVETYAVPVAALKRAQAPRVLNVAAASHNPMALLEGVAPFTIDNTQGYADHFAATAISSTLHVMIWEWDEALNDWVEEGYYPLYMEWPGSENPDTDLYHVKIASTAFTTTRVLTASNTLYYNVDDNDNPTGDPVAALGYSSVKPKETYTVTVGAHDTETGVTAWGTPRTVEIPFGTYSAGLSTARINVEPGSSEVVTLDLTISDDLFYDIDLWLILDDLPWEIDAYWPDVAQAVQNGRARTMAQPAGDPTYLSLDAPARRAPSAKDAERNPFQVARLAPQAVRETFEFHDPIAVEVAADAEPGLYTLPVWVVIGDEKTVLNLTIQVGQSQIFLPLVTRR